MARGWDIYAVRRDPPKGGSNKTSNKRRRSSKNCSFLILSILVLGASVLFFGKFSQTFTPGPASPKATAAPTNKPVGESIKILNGSGRFEETEVVSKILKTNNISVAKTETAVNLYDKTIIYYKLGHEKTAQKISELLVSYSPKLQQFSEAQDYDLAVIIGTK